MLTIHTLRALKDNFIYMIEDTAGERCAAVDPGEAAPVIDFLRAHSRLNLTHVLCTHHHWDHVNGVAELVNAFGCEVAGSVADKGRLPRQTLAVSEQHPLQLWGVEVGILDVPGHTLGQIAYRFSAEKAVFVGDTLFSAGCGRLFEGTPGQMFHSLQKFKALPANTRIYFGHEYTLRNLDFVLANLPDSSTDRLKAAASKARERALDLLKAGQPTAPAILQDEMEFNPFLLAKDIPEFTYWRELRNQY